MDQLLDDIKNRADQISEMKIKLEVEKTHLLDIISDLTLENKRLRSVDFKHFEDLITRFEETLDTFLKKVPFWNIIKGNTQILQIFKKIILPFIYICYISTTNRYIRNIDILLFQVITNIAILYYINLYSGTALTCFFT